MPRVEDRIDTLIQRIEAGEPIDHNREIVLAGLEFVRDSLERHGGADDEQNETLPGG